MKLNKPLRVAYAIQNVGGIDLSNGVGDSIPVKYTLRGLRQAGHEVTCLKLNGRLVVGIDDVDHLEDVWGASLGLSGVRAFKFVESVVRRIQRALKLPYFAFFDTYRYYEACVRYLPEYDLCHEHNGLFSLGAALACWRLKLPYVLTISADPLFELELIGKPLRGVHARIAAWEANLTYRIAKKIICVSKPAKRHLVEIWRVDPEKIVVLPNGVDVDLFSPAQDSSRERLQFGFNGAPVVAFVGGFQKWHGLDVLVESFSQIISEIPEAILLLVGDGPARSDVEKKVAELGLKNKVRITGFVPQADVPKFLSLTDVAVIPYPQFPEELWFSPLKLYEYMAAGKAIVASRSGQIAEVIRSGHNGILVNPGDVSGFSQAIVHLLRDPAERQRLGKNTRRQVVEQHSWTQYIQRLEEIYYSVLEESRAI
ncbi:MAG: glycosyltransferase family 4 protein [Anaerolineales bacterium]|jgi:glycosyltransferase involved in cell wall biosynthesis